MPRARPGGMRAGNPGTNYTNRSDLASQPNLPARVATNQTYGKAQSQLEAQRTIPMARPSVPLAPASPGGAAPPQPGAGGPAAAGAPTIAPGAFGALARPTERPLEPVTSGIPSGPGPGPEALPPGPLNSVSNNLSGLLASIAKNTGSPAIAALAQHAQAAGT